MGELNASICLVHLAIVVPLSSPYFPDLAGALVKQAVLEIALSQFSSNSLQTNSVPYINILSGLLVVTKLSGSLRFYFKENRSETYDISYLRVLVNIIRKLASSDEIPFPYSPYCTIRVYVHFRADMIRNKDAHDVA